MANYVSINIQLLIVSFIVGFVGMLKTDLIMHEIKKKRRYEWEDLLTKNID